MAVSHETTEDSSVFYTTWGFGNAHTLPLAPGAERPIEPIWIAGLQGEGHWVDERKGRDIAIEVTYSGYASHSALLAAFETDDSQTLTGFLTIGGGTYGDATFLGVSLISQPTRNGIDQLFYAHGVARWRLKG
jgi:hypothetical protein